MSNDSTFELDMGEQPSKKLRTTVALLLLACAAFYPRPSDQSPLMPTFLLAPSTVHGSNQVSEHYGLVFQATAAR